ncbi:MAG: nucleotide sugar dehydrogenase [Candidatus Latescibacteria bacterium]|nr:nucleotide sugar dehydrogenase [Candidatus Latescibacterota bacterium]
MEERNSVITLPPPSTLQEAIEQKTAKIAIVGLGYVGLPLAIEFGKAGFEVTGIDISTKKVKLINTGKSDVADVSEFEVAGLKAVGKLRATKDYSILKGINVTIVCVPTPLSKTRDPDVSYILDAFNRIKRYLHSEQLIILESTTYPGTSEELTLPLLAESGLIVGTDFFLAFSPERVDPGNKIYTIKNTPKIVGGITPRCTEMATLLYRQIIAEVIPVSNTKTAEMVKLLENTFRSVNIALVNEIALICDRLGIDVWEVIDAAATKPFGFMPFYPGPGLGGHCIPIDPHYLAWKLRVLDYNARFIELASEINRYMPHYVVEKVGDALNNRQKSFNGASILLLGITYKRDIDDIRESPALDIMKILINKGATVSYNDPFVPDVELDGQTFHSVHLSDELLQKTDCVVLATDHTAYNYRWIVEHASRIVDTRNATHNLNNCFENIIKI